MVAVSVAIARKAETESSGEITVFMEWAVIAIYPQYNNSDGADCQDWFMISIAWLTAAERKRTAEIAENSSV
jgi:hypothetical protein